MSKIEYTNNAKVRLSKSILDNVDTMSYNLCQKLLREKNIRVNGIRTKTDIELSGGELITIFNQNYTLDNIKKSIKTIFEDENILIIFKPCGLMVDGDSEISIKNLFNYYLVHRIDRNTEGILVLAKNIEAKNELDKAFFDGKIEKHYTALVKGQILKKEKITLYLFKNSKLSKVLVSDKPQKDYKTAITEISPIKHNDFCSIVDINLLTGRTHQIRASLAFVGNPVALDDKYGDKKFNNCSAIKLNFKSFKGYLLTSTSIKFSFESCNMLYYLNNKSFYESPSWQANSQLLFV